MMRLGAVFFVLLVIVTGVAYYFLRDDPLRAELDRRWPPVTADQQRQIAIDSAASALKEFTRPNIAAGADVATIQRIAFDSVKSKGVTKLVLAADRQLLRLTADIDVHLTSNDLPKDSDKKAIVAALDPHVVGQVELFLTVAVSVSNAPGRALVVKLLPAVSRVRIDKLTVKGSYDVTLAADGIAQLLGRYADNLSGVLSANPLMNITIPTSLEESFSPSRLIDLKEIPGLRLSLSARPIKSPFGLGVAAVLIDDGKVDVIVELAPLDKLPVKTIPANGSFEDVKTAFIKSLRYGLGITDPPRGVWMAAGKALVAQGLNSAFDQAKPCLDGSGPIPKQTFSAKIPMPDSKLECAPTRDCTPTKDCTPTRNCDLKVDRRNCRICVLPNVFTGGCSEWGNNPVCELAKGTQNGLYAKEKLECEASKTKEKVDCEGVKSLEKVRCETEKAGEKLACEAGKKALDLLHRTGNVGNVDGSIAGTGSLRLCLPNVHFDAALNELKLTITASGSASLDTHLKFVPLDAAHIFCPFPWTADKNITTTIPPQSIGASVSLARKADAGVLMYQGRLEELPIKLHFQPSPLSLVLQNINFQLACPVLAGMVNALTLGVGPLIPEFMKDYTYKLKPIPFSFKPELPTQSILGRNFKPALSETSLALIVSGVL